MCSALALGVQLVVHYISNSPFVFAPSSRLNFSICLWVAIVLGEPIHIDLKSILQMCHNFFLGINLARVLTSPLFIRSFSLGNVHFLTSKMSVYVCVCVCVCVWVSSVSFYMKRKTSLYIYRIVHIDIRLWFRIQFYDSFNFIANLFISSKLELKGNWISFQLFI